MCFCCLSAKWNRSDVSPLAHSGPRGDDRRVLSGIIYVIRNSLQWKDIPKGYGLHKTLYNCFIPWSSLGVFDRIFTALME